MNLAEHPGGARSLWADDLPDPAVGLAWLGQAGFALRHAARRLLLDPYLSDHLARKYAGTEFPHTRLVPPPIQAGQIRPLDFVLCSHRHSDHTDPGSLPTLARLNPACRFVLPRAELEPALALGLHASQLLPVNAGDTLRIDDSLEIRVIPAAHETLKTNDHGEHHFLGFILRLGPLKLYHSGDSLVYEGLARQLRPSAIDLALLPVNGRIERLSARGILGNMNFDEAAKLCIAAGIRTLIPHHFGMFEFNTVDPRRLRLQAGALDPALLRCVLPDIDRYYTLSAP